MPSAINTYLRAQAIRISAGAGLAVLLGMAWSVTPLLAGGVPTEALKGTINEVLRILADPNMKKPDRAQERRKLLEKVVSDRFNYEEMAKRTLAVQWQKLNDKERAEFVNLFMKLLTNSYADKVEGYSGEQIHYLNERLEGDYAEVRTKAKSGKAEIPLDYRLLGKGGDWRVYDVVVDGVSLVSNYRGQFAKIIRTSGYDDLVTRLREKSGQFVKLKTSTEKE